MPKKVSWFVSRRGAACCALSTRACPAKRNLRALVPCTLYCCTTVRTLAASSLLRPPCPTGVKSHLRDSDGSRRTCPWQQSAALAHPAHRRVHPQCAPPIPHRSPSSAYPRRLQSRDAFSALTHKFRPNRMATTNANPQSLPRFHLAAIALRLLPRDAQTPR